MEKKLNELLKNVTKEWKALQIFNIRPFYLKEIIELRKRDNPENIVKPENIEKPENKEN